MATIGGGRGGGGGRGLRPYRIDPGSPDPKLDIPRCRHAGGATTRVDVSNTMASHSCLKQICVRCEGGWVGVCARVRVGGGADMKYHSGLLVIRGGGKSAANLHEAVRRSHGTAATTHAVPSLCILFVTAAKVAVKTP